jgi:ubiquinone biosynthesis accessory factor UbiK
VIDPKQIKDVIESVFRNMPEGLKQMPEDVRAHLKVGLTRSLEGLDVVSREEFDVQVKVLAKTRAKLEVLEREIEALVKSRG